MKKQQSGGSRRQFLKKTAGIATAAAGALPAWYVQACVAQEAAKPKPPGVGEGLRVGLIGCGGQGSGAAQNAARLGAKIVAVCDVDEAHVAGAKKRWPEAETFSDFRKLLEQKNVDSVICGTPDHWHTL